MKDLKWTPNWRAAALGTGVGVLAMTAASAGAAGLVAGQRLAVESMGYLAAGILILTGLLGGLAAIGAGGTAADALVTAGMELVVLFALNAVLNGGQMEGIGVTLLALGGGCGAAVLLRLGRNGRSGRRRRRRKNR